MKELINVVTTECRPIGSKPRASQITEPTTSQGLQRNAHSQEDSPCVIHPNASHSTVECRKFLEMDVEERRLIVMKKGLCFYCLKRHLARYCPNQIPCVKCQSGHSDLLHVFLFLFYLPYLSSIHEKANCIAILWTVSPHSLGSCLSRGLWVTCLPHKGGASR